MSMLKFQTKNKFDKDVKRLAKRGKQLDKLYMVMDLLIHQKTNPIKLLDHPLKGNYVNCRECHIEPDWLLIYCIDNEQITFIRTGTHADLF